MHPTTWEWDNTGPSAHWKHSQLHPPQVHQRLGHGRRCRVRSTLRVTRDQRWRPFYLGNLRHNTLLAVFFEYGVAAQHLELGRKRKTPEDKAALKADLADVGAKIGRQVGKDYVLFPAAVGVIGRSTAAARDHGRELRGQHHPQPLDQRGHLLRALPDGAEKFTRKDMDGEVQGQWYLRQMLAARTSAGPVLGFMSGNLSYQIEHHLFPDLPSNRLPEISVRVQALAEKYDLPYTTGSLPVQYLKAWRTIAKLSLPDRFPDRDGRRCARNCLGITVSRPMIRQNTWSQRLIRDRTPRRAAHGDRRFASASPRQGDHSRPVVVEADPASDVRPRRPIGPTTARAGAGRCRHAQ